MKTMQPTRQTTRSPTKQVLIPIVTDPEDEPEDPIVVPTPEPPQPEPAPSEPEDPVIPPRPGGEKIPPGGWRGAETPRPGGEKIPPGGWRGAETHPRGRLGVLIGDSKPVELSPNGHNARSKESFFRDPPEHFVVNEWYGRVEHLLISNKDTHLTYLVWSDDEVFYTVYVFKYNCDMAINISSSYSKQEQPFRIISNSPTPGTPYYQDHKLDWSVWSFAVFGLKPYELI